MLGAFYTDALVPTCFSNFDRDETELSEYFEDKFKPEREDVLQTLVEVNVVHCHRYSHM